MEFQKKKKKALERNNILHEKIKTKNALLDSKRKKYDDIMLEQTTLELNICVGMVSRSTLKKITREVYSILLNILEKLYSLCIFLNNINYIYIFITCNES